MRKVCVVAQLLMAAVGALLLACADRSGEVPSDLRAQIALGEEVFQEKNCARCHSATGEDVQSASGAPDLASVFVAMDTVFVKSHLGSQEVSQMPPIELTPREISALTQYIGVLHAKVKMDPTLTDPDAVCPICGAPVSTSKAGALHLVESYEGKDYYFECPDCKFVFTTDPGVYSQSGWLKTRRGVVDLLR